MESQQLGNAIIDKQFLKNVIKNNEYNEIVGVYYSKLMREEVNLKKVLESKLERLEACNSLWLIDMYEKQKVKDYIKTNLCKDKFCNNCKKVKQASRMAKFMPIIDKYREYGLYQVVLTSPNVKGSELGITIKQQFKALGTLITYLKGKIRVKGLSFEKIGYMGAIRSLEVTYKGDDYHPHIHMLFCMTGDIGEKVHRNQYSIDHYGKREERLFSDLEILIQKIWYLLMNGQKVTKKAIDELNLGYSCMIDKCNEEDYLELFKYMVKGDGADREEAGSSLMTYSHFKTLYFALNRVRQIQGYGVFYNITDDDSIVDEVDDYYELLVQYLKKEEDPVQVSQTPQDLYGDLEYTLISRKRIFKYLREIQN